MRVLLAVLAVAVLPAFGMGTRVPEPDASNPGHQVLGLTGEKQERRNWCALAATQMLMSQYGVKVSQCEIASNVVKEDCCARNSIRCEQPQRVEWIAPQFGFSSRALAISFPSVVSRIKAGKPVVIYHYQGSDSGHAVVAYWTYVRDGRDYIVVFDPWTGGKRFWSSDYVEGNLAWYGVREIVR